ncbi:MAG TPA: PilT/PilU family type 4a pilus ATPase [Thermoanaerobaculia bacterium]|nr:PilT/PilU family type 4a pilus ATPase [Thermoanaerobaculia bacterium]
MDPGILRSIMALFQSELKDTVRKLSTKEFSSAEERDQLLERLLSSDEVKPRDVTWMLFRPDRALRDAAVKILGKLRDPETIDLFITESKGKPEAAMRAATSVIFGLGIPGLEARLAQSATSADKDTAESARRIILEAPPSKALEPLLWQFATAGRPEERLQFLNRLGNLEIDSKTLPRWQKLARDSSREVRARALTVLATKAPEASIDLLVEQLPLADYATQQLLVEALTRAAAGKGPEFADRILPLMASGDAGTRSAVLKILLGMGHRRDLVRRYIMFSKSLAGWARDRSLDSMKAFGDDLLEPTIELLSDPDDEIRGAAMIVAGSFDDVRIVPATIRLLEDPDWWIRITAIETLGRLKDPRAVDPIIKALDDGDARWSAVEALGHIADPRALSHFGKLLADPNPDIRIEVLQALRHFDHPQVVPVLQKVAQTDPARFVRTRAIDIAEEVSARNHTELTGAAELRASAATAVSSQGEPKLHTLLVATRNQGGSDFHFSVGQPPIVRIASDLLRAQAEPFTPEQTEAMLREILTDAQWERLQREQQLDFCYFIPQAGRYRANVFVDQKGYNAVFRVIAEKPPTITEVGLPPHLAEIADFHQGLVLLCGTSGSGKSTTLAALVNLFNETRHDHVLTLEDPVEFVHPFKNCLINQREVGTHTESFARALRAALREDPDVIVIGEMRDNETVALALTAAETGHIVLGTINSTSAPKAIDRVIGSFPAEEQAQIRTAMSESLKYVIAQRLLPAKEGRKLVACFEVLKGTTSIGNMIRDEKTFQIHSAMQIGRSQGMQTFDEALKELVRRNQITAETAYMAADKKEEFEPLVSPEFLKTTVL